MIATSHPDRRKYRRTAPGPFATPERALTDEGRAYLEEWLTRWNPVSLLAAKHRALVRAAEHKFGPEMTKAICLLGCTQAMVTYDPDKAPAFSTYAVHGMRNALSAEFAVFNKLAKYDVRLVDGSKPVAPGDPKTHFDLVAVEPGPHAIHYLELREKILAALNRRVKCERHREIFRLKYGLHTGEIMFNRAVGEIYGISQSRVDQITTRVYELIRNDISELWEAAK